MLIITDGVSQLTTHNYFTRRAADVIAISGDRISCQLTGHSTAIRCLTFFCVFSPLATSVGDDKNQRTSHSFTRVLRPWSTPRGLWVVVDCMRGSVRGWWSKTDDGAVASPVYWLYCAAAAAGRVTPGMSTSSYDSANSISECVLSHVWQTIIFACRVL